MLRGSDPGEWPERQNELGSVICGHSSPPTARPIPRAPIELSSFDVGKSKFDLIHDIIDEIGEG
jgi:hypothetical protein